MAATKIEDRAPARLYRAHPRATAAQSDVVTRSTPQSAGSRQNPDEAKVSPRVSPSVRVVPAISAQRAFVACGHLAVRHAQRHRPLPDHAAKVDWGGPRWRHLSERREDLRADLVAGLADGGPKVHHEFARVAPEGVDQRPHARFDHPRSRAPPPRVEQPDRPGNRIHDENGYAVGQCDGEEHPGRSGDVSVPFTEPAHSRGNTRMHPTAGPMHLPAPDHGAPTAGKRPVRIVGRSPRRSRAEPRKECLPARDGRRRNGGCIHVIPVTCLASALTPA